MNKTRLEAFSDGVLAIVITIMVLELRPPSGAGFADLFAESPTFVSYVLSFVYVGIYWSNHHHMLQAARRVSGAVLLANLLLLFCLSLVPFTTEWLGRTNFASAPTVVYGVNLLAAALAYSGLQRTLIAADDQGSTLRRAVGSDVKGKASILIYAVAIALAFVAHTIADALYAVVAAIWMIPDRRIERLIGGDPRGAEDAA